MTDPKNKYVPFKKPKRISLDGTDVSKRPSGKWAKTMRTEDVESVAKKVESGVKHKPSGATMKAITGSTYKKAKRKFKTNYKSTGSKKGKSTPGRKRRRGA